MSLLFFFWYLGLLISKNQFLLLIKLNTLFQEQLYLCAKDLEKAMLKGRELNLKPQSGEGFWVVMGAPCLIYGTIECF